MSFSNNIFALLDNEDGGAPVSKKASKKPTAAAAAPAAGNKKAIVAHSFPGEQPAGAAKPVRTQDRARDVQATAGRGGRGGATRGGRGGRNGSEDPSVRQFDRRGAPTKHAPRHAHRDGAALGPEGGAAGVITQGESAADAAAPEVVVDEVADMVFEEVDEDDGTLTYDAFIAARAAKAVEDDANISIREVINDESLFTKSKPMVRADAEEKAAAAAAEEERIARKKSAKAQRSEAIINLDEFRGGREADAKYRPQSASFGGRGGFVEGGRGGRGGARGGRGAFTARPAAGADGAAAPVASGEGAPTRGGRGGARGGRGGAFVPRGGRGGAFVPRGGARAAAAPIALKDERAFPALA